MFKLICTITRAEKNLDFDMKKDGQDVIAISSVCTILDMLGLKASELAFRFDTLKTMVVSNFTVYGSVRWWAKEAFDVYPVATCNLGRPAAWITA